MPSYGPYAILTAMLAPAFFLTATASLLMSANTRLARVVDRLRSLLHELNSVGAEGAADRELLDRRIVKQRRRTQLILRGSQLLYVAISSFVATSLFVAIDGFLGHRLGVLPTLFAVIGVLAMFAASLYLSRESSLAVQAINEEMDHAHARA
ncbi:MAG: DUF2721 domain-containing protein, partial [Pseudomonadota bacterium]|nr:DUF2721 domain-containing protein [Pseudomonadota bacterium]